jgi:hypothetical protein
MWAKLDDGLLDHPKILAAAEQLGGNSQAIVVGVYVMGLLWSARHLTDGHLPTSFVRAFAKTSNPLSIADALVKVGLWEADSGKGFRIHDYAEYNPKASHIKAKRRKERLRKQAERHGKDDAN